MRNEDNDERGPLWRQSEGYIDSAHTERGNSAVVVLSAIVIVVLLLTIALVGTKLSEYLQSNANNRPSPSDAQGSISLSIRDSDYSQSDYGMSAAEVYAAAQQGLVTVRVYTGINEFAPHTVCTGAILSADGYILVNASVLENGKIFEVTDCSGISRTAVLVGYDRISDVGLLKLNATRLTPVSGNTFTVQSGERVVSVTTVNGMPQSVCEDTVAASDRVICYLCSGGEVCVGTFIQTTNDMAASGGLLFNRFGELMGLYSSNVPSPYTNKAGLAVGVKQIENIANSIIDNGYVRGRCCLPFTLEEVPASIARRHGLSGACLRIAQLQSEDLRELGFSENLILTAVNNTPFGSLNALVQFMLQQQPGTVLRLTLYNTESNKVENISYELTEQRGLWSD